MNCMRTVSGKLRSRRHRGRHARRVAACTSVNHHEHVAPRRPNTREFSQGDRDQLGKAVTRARERAGYTWARLTEAAGIGKTSLFKLERGEPVGPKVYEAVARALPDWDEDTPVTILRGGPVPSPAKSTAASREAVELAALAVIQDGSKVGTDEWLAACAVLLDGDDLLEAQQAGLDVRRKRGELEIVLRRVAERAQSDSARSETSRVD